MLLEGQRKEIRELFLNEIIKQNIKLYSLLNIKSI
jgi:hypothetical protein